MIPIRLNSKKEFHNSKREIHDEKMISAFDTHLELVKATFKLLGLEHIRSLVSSTIVEMITMSNSSPSKLPITFTCK